MTQAFTSPITSRLKGGLFNPLEFNPYLLFDAQTSMLGELEAPTLDLDASDESTLDVITATRAGVATYTDLHGTIQTASADTVRVDYVQGEELTPTVYQHFINTDFDNSAWAKGSYVSIESNYDTAPNGEEEAFRFVSIGGSYPQMIEYVTSLTIGQEYTASFYVKSDGTSQIQQSAHFTGVGSTVDFTPTNEWQRISVTITATATTHAFVIFTNSPSAPASSYLIWGPQLEEGTSATDFVPNTTGSPKFIASATYGPRVPMMLIEPSATNLVDDSTSYSYNTITPTSGIDAPDGTNTATRFEGLLGASGDVLYSRAYSVTPSSQITGSIYLRGTAGEVVSINIKRHSGGTYVGSPTQDVLLTGEWQRVENMTLTLNADNTNASIVIKKTAQSTADAFDVWGGQIELGSVSTSFIPTSGSAVTRNADNLTIYGSNFTDFYNGSEGTFYIESQVRDATPEIYFLRGDATTQRFLYSNNTSESLNSWDGTTGLSLGSITDNQLFRAAISYISGSERNASLNGSADSTALQNTNWDAPTELRIGRLGTQGQINGHIRRLLYWPTHSSSL